MAKTLLELLAGEDMEGGESFCDDVYNFLKNQGKDINLLTNSGFGVWSQSDAAKGLAEVPYNTGSEGGGDVPDVGDTATGGTSGATGKIISYTITGGGFDTNNAAGVLTLGAVTGTFQTGETINFTDLEAALVGVDTDIGVKNDPCNNDSTGIWTRDAGLNLAFGVALYTVDTNAVNLRAWITAGATLVAGKIYKIELDINNGVVNTKGVQGYFDDGAAQYGRIRTTGVGFASFSWTFECATSTAAGKVGFRIVENLGGAGQNIQIRRFSCYEITPCSTSGAVAFDGWHKDPTLDIYRQHNDGGTLTKDGSFYSLKVVPSIVDDFVRFPVGITSLVEWYQQFAGRTVTCGMWIKTSTASHARFYLYDGSAASVSSYHTGGGSWEWIEATHDTAASPNQFVIQIEAKATPAIDGSTIVYVSQPMLVFGSSIGEDMYQPRLQEIVYVEKKIVSNTLVGTGFGTVAIVDLNLETDSDAMLPKGCRAILIDTTVRDSGSAGAGCFLYFRADATVNAGFINRPHGKVGDTWSQLLGWVKCDSDGDLQYEIIATGGATFDINDCNYLAVQVN